ncbi:MAG TPA: thioredoxin [Erysipelotrichaceae bacterium]|nr:thioredoxin [Erysipelotrichaceae bacterium]
MSHQLYRITSEEQLNEIMNKNEVSVLYFTTPTCNVCKSIFPRLEELMKEYKNVPLLKIDAASLVETTAQHLVFTVPTILVYNSGKEVLRESRFIDFSKIDRMLDLLKN